MYKKFYKLSSQERRTILQDNGRYDFDLDVPLPESTSENMIENNITLYELPMGVVTGFLMNDKEYVIPMVTEEPSVIAAANNAARIFASNGGLKAKVISRLMRGEIAFSNPLYDYGEYIDNHYDELIDLCNRSYPSIVNRGGGVQSIKHRLIYNENKPSFFIVDVTIDTQEAMGANMINTILEALQAYLQEIYNHEPLMAILSNLADECLVEGTIEINPETLRFPESIAQRLEEAYQLASVDPYRAATHNKGIMNGIDAVVIASGNDWRAVEAGAHAYASRSGSYQPLTTWSIADNGNILGSIIIPMAIGTVGGTVKLHPKAALAKKIMDYSDAKELMALIAGIGLAQNFAALYALTTDGIQKGHMRMHARSLAMNAGANENEIQEVVRRLIKDKPMTLQKAESILKEIRR